MVPSSRRRALLVTLATALAIIMIGLSFILEPESGPVVAEPETPRVREIAQGGQALANAAAPRMDEGGKAATLVNAEAWELDYAVTLTQTLPNAPTGLATETKASASLADRIFDCFC